MVNVNEGRVVGKVETGREKIGGENGTFGKCSREKADGAEIPAFACALHPQSSAYAWAGRSSKIGIRSIVPDSLGDQETQDGEANGNGLSSSEAVGKGPLGGEGKIVDTGKGKFVMDMKYVSFFSHYDSHDWSQADDQSPDGRQLALSTENGHITILDAESQSVVATYQSHAMAVRTISWSHDSQVRFS